MTQQHVVLRSLFQKCVRARRETGGGRRRRERERITARVGETVIQRTRSYDYGTVRGAVSRACAVESSGRKGGGESCVKMLSGAACASATSATSRRSQER